MAKVDAIDSSFREISSEKISSGKKSRPNSYVRKDPTHGAGYFFYSEYVKKDGTISYNWYFVNYVNGKRQPKEYLGTSESAHFLPSGKRSKCELYHKELFARIKSARAYKNKNGGKPEHST